MRGSRSCNVRLEPPFTLHDCGPIGYEILFKYKLLFHTKTEKNKYSSRKNAGTIPADRKPEKARPKDPVSDQELRQNEPPILLHRTRGQSSRPSRQPPLPTLSVTAHR
jgi:hypothetical protein